MAQADKRALLAEGLAAGDDDAALLARLVAAGVSAASAKYEIDRLGKDPMAAMLRRQAARMAKQSWLFANQRRLAFEAEGGFALDTLDKPDPGFFYRYHYEANRPARLTGLIDHWPALARWSLDHFAAVAGDAVVEAQVERERDPDYEVAKDDHRRRVRFGEMIDWLRKDEPSNDVYLTAYNSGTNAAALAPFVGRYGADRLARSAAARRLFLAGAEGDAHPLAPRPHQQSAGAGAGPQACADGAALGLCADAEQPALLFRLGQ